MITDPTRAVPQQAGPGDARRCLGGAVLVVEDDSAVRELLVEYLEEAGFFVLRAEGAEEALRILAETSNIKVVVSDVQMPGMSGIELANVVSELADVKVILISGYFQPQPINSRFLRKPFRMRDLEAAIREEFQL